jgi:hypothetical protein
MNAPASDEARRLLVRRIARRVPRELRELRGKAMLEDLHETLGVEDAPCPACAATGWLDAARLEHCPVCCGFCEVPDELAAWFKCRLACAAQESGPASEGEGAPGAWRPSERPGRLAEVLYHAHLPEDA